MTEDFIKHSNKFTSSSSSVSPPLLLQIIRYDLVAPKSMFIIWIVIHTLEASISIKSHQVNLCTDANNKSVTFTDISNLLFIFCHIKWVPVTTAWRVLALQLEEDGLHAWTIATNILNKQSLTADKGCPFRLGVRRELTTPHRKMSVCYDILHRASDLAGSYEHGNET
jgi:hypothetical protein